MEVSTFELLIKRIAPTAGLPADIQGGIRRVVQGYFLTISNLESQDLRFRIEFVDSDPSPDNTNRRLSVSPRNFDLLFDTAGSNVPLIGTSTFFAGNPTGGTFTLAAGQTASVQLLPTLAPFMPQVGGPPTPLPSPLNNPNPQLEIRGYVRLRLPPNNRFIPGLPPRFISEPQLPNPAKVLLQPEIRGTFLPNSFSALAPGDFDQINYSLVTASGQALNEIEPEGQLTVDPVLVMSTFQRLQAEGFDLERLEGLDNQTQITRLVESIAQLETSPENLEQVSDLLSKLEIPVRMTPV